MQFRYTEVKSGLYRPLLAIVVWGPSGPVWTDGLVDTGADYTLLTHDLTLRLGIDIKSLTTEVHVQSATGHRLRCKILSLPIEVAKKPKRICWQAEVAVAMERIQRSHWGFKGFLEYFRTTLDGPKRMFTLIPGVNLPTINPPSSP
jgi:hypothetical protein